MHFVNVLMAELWLPLARYASPRHSQQCLHMTCHMTTNTATDVSTHLSSGKTERMV